MQNVAQRENAPETKMLVHDDQAVNPRFTYGVQNGVKAIIDRTGVYAGEVLTAVLDPVQLGAKRRWRRLLETSS